MTVVAQAENGLTQPPPLALDTDAFPHPPATDAAAQQVNAALAAQNAKDLTEFRASKGGRSIATAHPSVGNLCLQISVDAYCEAASYAFHGQLPLRYDLITGAEVDWPTLLPKSLLDLDADADYYDENHPARSQALTSAYLKELTDITADYAAAYDPPLNVDFWLGTQHQGLAFSPNTLAYTEPACVTRANLSTARLQSLGADSS